MQIHILDNADRLGFEAAQASEAVLKQVIAEKGSARIALSTGASQFEFLKHFVRTDIEWDKVEMFHLDEYIALPEQHPASFRKYLKERFLAHVNIGKYWMVDGEGDAEETIRLLNEEISRAPIDLALIGIGENAHIAFNDPPADFDKADPYHIVNLNDTCKLQQVGEGWFSSLEDVPRQAISMSVKQIMRSLRIISCVPHKTKAKAVSRTLRSALDPECPATMLKSHPDWQLYLDKESASDIYVWVEETSKNLAT
ncbi:glucosamine-6-phosphate deaminase [Paenibacillus spongiae]|uniref:Glucosamine-6-phosphate deaminase n=1 Tax=Paenibacillus spongiae TaxID=2909671 RepID=A0ABY5S423_9BACL|nr:glucosamine-6-phosphate deaminase [Paenibacillus spongiae]UVI27595.1 glucosamine-6-phosphate deaminase [Paenibacillus spongiae]